MVQIKICGITDQESFEACVRCKVDWIGFVFFKYSPRFIMPEQAAALSSSKGGPKRVGLFVDPDVEQISHVLRHVNLDVLQLYTDRQKATLFAQHFHLPVWLSLPISQFSDLPHLIPQQEKIERVVIEPKPPAKATRPGGNGHTMEWSLLSKWRPSFLWMLAGGLTPQNVAQAIKPTGAKAVDVSSGVEKAPGIKSADLIECFVKVVRG
ncbi:MAG: phosphoribosylanthranilate isomerase [Acetobacter sp.]|nr:phosphoribosylanthranilate isomerase [Acetobacter sp.]